LKISAEVLRALSIIPKLKKEYLKVIIHYSASNTHMLEIRFYVGLHNDDRHIHRAILPNFSYPG